MTIKQNGAEIYYQLFGAGDPLLLLHGFMGAGQDWAPLTADWAAHFQLIVPDLRGHGRSSNPSPGFRHDEAAGDVLALLDELGVSACKAVGVSGGGNVLLHVATRQPDRVKAMVLVSATTYFPTQAREIMRAYSIDMLPEPEREALRRRHPGGPAQIDALFAQARAFADSYDDLNFDRGNLARITARTLIVQGDRDPFYPLQISVDMAAAIPHSSLWVVRGGGHGPIGGERWPKFVATALAFLRA